MAVVAEVKRTCSVERPCRGRSLHSYLIRSAKPTGWVLLTDAEQYGAAQVTHCPWCGGELVDTYVPTGTDVPLKEVVLFTSVRVEPSNSDPLDCDCYGGCWGVHAVDRVWPRFIFDTDKQAETAYRLIFQETTPGVVRRKPIVGRGGFVLMHNTLLVHSTDAFDRVSDLLIIAGWIDIGRAADTLRVLASAGALNRKSNDYEIAKALIERLGG